MIFQHFKGAIAFTAVCMALAVMYGWQATHSIAGTGELVWIVAVLAMLELSLSFDNAVVNATVLQDMDQVWRQRFLTWGLIFAVFGVRIVFPLVIVAVAAHIGPMEALRVSLTEPERYQQIVTSAHHAISGFGGAFLTMVGLKFFFDEEKEVHWVGLIERQLSRISALPAVEIALLLVILWAVATALPDAEGYGFLEAGLFGIVAFIAVDALGTALELREEKQRLAGAVVRAGLGGFLYLNVLDASFSFDGVIGAFALSNNMVVIALGLSIGAIFVRSMTVMLVEKGTLAEYRYLEHGAYWAILALGGIMLASVLVDVSETVTGLIGAVLIAASIFWSVRVNRKEAAT